jgi:uncharacterized membrane protein
MFLDESMFLVAFLQALAFIVAFVLSAWGALFVVWGAAKAIRRSFWTEAEPWKGPQTPRLEEIRRMFGQRILLGLEFFLAGDIVRFLVDPGPRELIRVGALALIRIALSFFVTRELQMPTTRDARAPVRPSRPRKVVVS